MKKLVVIGLMLLTLVNLVGCNKNEKDFYAYSTFDDDKIIDLCKEELKGDYNIDLRKDFGNDYRDRLKVSAPVLWYVSGDDRYLWAVPVWLDGVDVYCFIGTQADDCTVEVITRWSYTSSPEEVKESTNHLNEWINFADKTTEQEPMFIYTATLIDGQSQVYVVIGDKAYNTNAKEDVIDNSFGIDLSNTHVVNFGY